LLALSPNDSTFLSPKPCSRLLCVLIDSISLRNWVSALPRGRGVFVNIHRPTTSLTCKTQVPHCLLHTSPVQCQKSNPKQKTDPIADFFARFPDYNYNPNCTWPEEWRKLRQSLEEQLQRAAIERFQATYTSDLAAWHKMCRVLGIVPPPPTHQRCRRVRGPTPVRE